MRTKKYAYQHKSKSSSTQTGCTNCNLIRLYYTLLHYKKGFSEQYNIVLLKNGQQYILIIMKAQIKLIGAIFENEIHLR